MSILKALQKKQVEQTNTGAEAPKGAVVPFDRSGRQSARRANTPPEMFADRDF